MTTQLDPAAQARRRAAQAAHRTTTALLAAGAVAGPAFVLTAGVQALTRPGFDLARHPISMLSVGDGGWVQITNFIVAGLLQLAFAVGVSRTVTAGPSHRWAPWLLGLHGVGLVIGGAFPADPALGFPAGAPEGIPETMSLHATVHAFAPPLAFISLVLAMLVVARLLSWEGSRRAAACTRLVSLACFVLAVPVGPGFSVRLFLAVALGFAWITALGLSLLRRRAARG